MKEEKALYTAHPIERAILMIRGHKVILDSDLADIYGVPTKRLNEQVRRNADRFPSDFVFQLTSQEVMNLKSQSATSSLQPIDMQDNIGNWSQFATSSRKHRGATYRPFAFTEHGAIMVATVLNSPRAVQMSVFVVRAFIKIREQLLSRVELEKRLTDIEKTLMGHDTALRDLYQKIRPLLMPPVSPTKEVTGFRVRERHALYAIKRQRRSNKVTR